MANAKKTDLLLLCLNQFIWGTGWSAIKSAQEQMGPVTLNLWSLGISVLALCPFVYARVHDFTFRPARKWLDYAVMGIVGLAGMTLLYAWGAGRSLAANGALISMAVPVLTAVIAVVVLGEKLTPGRVVGLAAALIGVLVISDIGWSQVNLFGSYFFPSLLLFGGAFCNGVYVVYSKKLLASASPVVLLFWGQLLGFLASLPFVWFEKPRIATIAAYTGGTWLSLAFLGVVYFALTMIVFFRILARLDAGQIMVSNYLQPVFGVLMAAILLREEITWRMAGGGLLVLLGTGLATYGDSCGEKKQRQSTGGLAA